MAIELNDGSRIAAPVIRQQRLGEVAYLAIVRPEQRDRLRKNLTSGAMEPIPNGTDRQGRPNGHPCDRHARHDDGGPHR